MAPKAYDDEEVARQRVLSGDIETGPPAVAAAPFRLGLFASSQIGLGEIIAAISLLYFCTIASFNAGYFSAVHGNFVELFTFTDLIGINIPILQYFFVIFFLYAVISTFATMLGSFRGVSLSNELSRMAQDFMLKHHYSNSAYWIGYGVLLAAVWGGAILFPIFGITNFTLVMLPSVFFQGCFIYFFWVGYKFQLVPAKSLFAATLLALFIFSNNAGHAWILSEIGSSENIQAIVGDKDVCLERIILRNSNAGLLLYNPTMKKFEFRSKESIRTIFQGRGCN